MSDNGDVNDFGDVEEPEPDVGEDPFGGSDLEPVTDDEEDDDDGEDLMENQEMCAPDRTLVFFELAPQLAHLE